MAYTVSLAEVTPVISAAPTYAELGPLDIAGGGGLSWSEIHNAEEEGTVSVSPEALPPSIKTTLRQLFSDDPGDIPWLEIWITKDTTPVHRGRIVSAQFQQNDSGLVLTLHSRGPLYELRSMFVRTPTTFTGVDQHTIVTDLIDTWQAEDYGHLGIDTSGVSASGQTRTITYDPLELPNVYEKVSELADRINGFDWWIDLETGPENRVLNLGTRGTDLTGTVVLDRRGLVDTGLALSFAAEDLASEGYGVGQPKEGDPFDSEFSNTSLRQSFGRRGVGATFNDVELQATADDYTEELQTSRSLPLVTPQPQLIPVAGADEMDFGAGDTVQFVPRLGIDSDTDIVVLSRRVMAKRVSVGDDGNVSMGVEFF